MPDDTVSLWIDDITIGPSQLIDPGKVAVMLEDESVQYLPATDLRNYCQGVGSGKIKAFLMSPSDFDKLRAVMRKREEAAAVDAGERRRA